MYHDLISKALMSVTFRVVITPSKRMGKVRSVIIAVMFCVGEIAPKAEEGSQIIYHSLNLSN
jgi:hypothetical protein